MRIATFNILHGARVEDDHVDVDALAEAARRLDADVLSLQEVDRFQPRSAYADLTAVAAEAMGAAEHRFVAALSGTPGATWMAATGEEQPDSAAYGIALLSRHPVTAWEVIRLPPLPVPVPMWFPGSRRPVWVRDEPRVAVAATVTAPGLGPVTVAGTHLTFVRGWNRRQLRTLVGALPRSTTAVLAGDLNLGPAVAAKITGLRPLASGATFPADAPTEQLDHLLGTPDLRSLHSEVVPLPLSDHRALVAEIA